MNLETYSLAAEDDFTLFRFVSKGRRQIDKIVQFQKLDEGFYNLAFGDRSLITGGLDDLAVSNNGDSERVLATVVGALRVFFSHHAAVAMYASGSTTARTRLYRMGITKFWEEARREFLLYGLVGGELHPFEPGVTYDGFLARRKPL